MVLIDAVYINNGGGKILLDYLISNLTSSNIDVYFLLDKRVVGKHPIINKDKVTYLEGNFIKRYFYYSKNKEQFSKVFCFGNLPPNIKLKIEVFTYFHQPIYLNVPNEFSRINRLKFELKIFIFKKIAKNSDYWLVQSNFIKQELEYKFGFTKKSIKVLPFYPQFEKLKTEIVREINTFIYVSNGTPHKNHNRLISVFCKFYDKYQKGKLILTISDDYPDILELIQNKLNLGYPIENIGFVDRVTLCKKYSASTFLIFPSFAESFGLGLIEAIDCGCHVIAADLPYSYEVCKPTLCFNPADDASMFAAFEYSLNSDNLPPSIPHIQNNIEKVISLLK